MHVRQRPFRRSKIFNDPRREAAKKSNALHHGKLLFVDATPIVFGLSLLGCPAPGFRCACAQFTHDHRFVHCGMPLLAFDIFKLCVVAALCVVASQVSVATYNIELLSEWVIKGIGAFTSSCSWIFSGAINIAAVTSRDGSKYFQVRISSVRKMVLASKTGISLAMDQRMLLGQLRSRSIIAVN